jgi:CRP-like cAMP-binding protein
LNQGDLFGEIALLATGGKRSASVQAEGDVLLLEINWKNFYQLMAQNLVLAREFERVAISRLKSPAPQD